MSDSARHQILAAIGTTSDPAMKSVLLLMLAVLEDIGGKIDAIRNDEKGLRELVFNGHQDVHHAHHEWITEKIRNEKDEAQAEKDSRRKIRDTIVEKVLWLALVAIAGYGGWHLK